MSYVKHDVTIAPRGSRSKFRVGHLRVDEHPSRIPPYINEEEIIVLVKQYLILFHFRLVY